MTTKYNYFWSMAAVLALAGCQEAPSEPSRNDAGRSADAGVAPGWDIGPPPDAWYPPPPDAWYPAPPDAWYPAPPDAWYPAPPDVYIPPGVDGGPPPDAWYPPPPDAWYPPPPDAWYPPPPDAFFASPDAGPVPVPMSQITYENCMCGTTPGIRAVFNGTRSTCGCFGPDGGIMTRPPNPPVYTCPNQGMCPPYLEPDTAVSARSCCTTAGRCGSASNFLYGTACVDRIDPGPDGRVVVPPLVNHVVNGQPECPDEQVVFVDATGCCLPSGQCGLAVSQVSNFEDVGCMPRRQMRDLLDNGDGEPFSAPAGGERFYLALVFLLGDYLRPIDDPRTPRREWDVDTVFRCNPNP